MVKGRPGHGKMKRTSNSLHYIDPVSYYPWAPGVHVAGQCIFILQCLECCTFYAITAFEKLPLLMLMPILQGIVHVQGMLVLSGLWSVEGKWTIFTLIQAEQEAPY